MHLGESIPCQIPSCDAKIESHVLHGLDIDFSCESCVNFVASEDSHSERIIHCYMLGISNTGRFLSYIPVLQLTMPQIIELVNKDNVASIRFIIIFSKISDVSIYKNVVAKSLKIRTPPSNSSNESYLVSAAPREIATGSKTVNTIKNGKGKNAKKLSKKDKTAADILLELDSSSLWQDEEAANVIKENKVKIKTVDKIKKGKGKKAKTLSKNDKTVEDILLELEVDASLLCQDEEAEQLRVKQHFLVSKQIKNPLLSGKVTKEMIEGTSLYAGFELVAMYISRCAVSKTMKRLVPLLLPFFDTPLLPIRMLEDLKELPLLRSAMIRDSKLSDEFTVKLVPDRIKTFSLSGINRNFVDLHNNLNKGNAISFMVLCQPVPCPICSTGEPFHINIDLSRDSVVRFTSADGQLEIHRDHIIHYYALGLDAHGAALSYVSLVQLPVEKIASLLSRKGISSVRIEVVLSSEFQNDHEVFKNCLAFPT